MTRALALELAFKGIRVNAIAPGWFVTDLNREYLAGEAGVKLKREIPIGRFVTGATIVADGGQIVALRGA